MARYNDSLYSSICPRCMAKGQIRNLDPVSSRNSGFSAGKAVVGAALVGPIGLAAGALGKKKTTYMCQECGYMIER